MKSAKISMLRIIDLMNHKSKFLQGGTGAMSIEKIHATIKT